jgi:hypothetical protein
MFLQSFGPGKGPFDEPMLFVRRLVPAPVDKPRVGGHLKIVVLLLPGSVGRVQGNRGTILQNFQGRVSLQLLLNLFPQVHNRKLHQLDGLIKLGAHSVSLFLYECGTLQLHGKPSLRLLKTIVPLGRFVKNAADRIGRNHYDEGGGLAWTYMSGWRP